MADKKMELIVNVNVTSAGTAVAATSVNTVGVIVTDSVLSGKSETVGKYYSGADQVKDIFGKNSDAYGYARIFFGQARHPDRLYIGIAESLDEDDIEAVMDMPEFVDVYHWVLMQETPSTDAQRDATFELLKNLNTKAAADYKNVHVEFDCSNATELNSIKAVFDGFDYTPTSSQSQKHVAGLAETQTTRLAVYCHNMGLYKEVGGENEPVRVYDVDHIGAAICADRCGADPARGTWAHKSLVGVSPMALTKAQLQQAKDSGYNVYTSIAQSPRLFMGTTCSNANFIDTIIKADVLKFRIQEAVFGALQTGNEGYGIDYDDDGIASLGGSVTNELNSAFNNHYIHDDFSLSLPLFADIPASDKAIRKISGIKGSVRLMDSIHTVVSIDITAQK